MRTFREIDFRDYTASALVAYARATVATEPRLAARALGAASAIRAQLGPAFFHWEREWSERALDDVRQLLGDDAVDVEVEIGASVPGDTISDVLATDPAS